MDHDIKQYNIEKALRAVMKANNSKAGVEMNKDGFRVFPVSQDYYLNNGNNKPEKLPRL